MKEFELYQLAGDLKKEMQEFSRTIDKKCVAEAAETFTAECTAMFTVICC